MSVGQRVFGQLTGSLFAAEKINRNFEKKSSFSKKKYFSVRSVERVRTMTLKNPDKGTL
jgi:hypothetical protein